MRADVTAVVTNAPGQQTTTVVPGALSIEPPQLRVAETATTTVANVTAWSDSVGGPSTDRRSIRFSYRLPSGTRLLTITFTGGFPARFDYFERTNSRRMLGLSVERVRATWS